MVLKRKRSECDLGSIFASPQGVASESFNFNSIAAMETARRGFFAPRLSTPGHLPSRTMKRFRDNRPSAADIYQHTLDVLYSAQCRLSEPHHSSLPPHGVPAVELAQTDTRAQSHANFQQRSLHSFWNLPGAVSSTNSLVSSPASSAMSPPSPALAPRSISTNCEDCGAGLSSGDNDVMMELDGYGSGREDRICGACGKSVCFSCSVSNLGECRRCLPCAGTRGRGAGTSWMRRQL